MSEFTKSDALGILKSRKVVQGSGKYTVKVTSVHPHEGKHIVNINAMNLFGANQAKELLVQGEYHDACNTNLSISVFEGQECPTKGEFINVMIDDVVLKDGSTAKLVAGWSEIRVTEAATFSFEDVEDEVAGEVADSVAGAVA